MRRNAAVGGQIASSRSSKAGSIACLLFIAILGGAFWAGALWAAQPWAH